MKLALAVAVLLFPITFSGALGADADPDCQNAVAQMDMNMCADRDFQKADAALHKAYKDATKDMDAHALDLLRKAQRAWIAFRDAECTYETVGDEGGSIQPMDYSNCLTRLTKLRTKELRAGGN